MTAKASKVDTALDLAKRGFRVFPLQKNSKEPIKGVGWKAMVTADPGKIRALWQKYNDANIAIATDGLLVVDEDNKQGKRGADSLALLELQHDDLAQTLVCLTPTGGRHHIFKAESIRNSAGKLGPGLDVRATGGYIVAPGSATDKGVYTIEHDAPIADAPDWLISLAGKKLTSKCEEEFAENAEPDSDGNLAKAIAYLTESADPAVEGEGGNETTFKTAARLRDFGVSSNMAQVLLTEHYNPRCEPPWHPDELETIVSNAYRYGENPIGQTSAAADFTEAGPELVTWRAQPVRERLYAVRFSDITPERLDLDRIALIEDYLDQEAMSVVYGASNAGKSFVALDAAFHVAAGLPWYGKETKPGPVLYVAAEGGRKFFQRVEALRRHYKVDDVPLYVVPCQVDLLRPKADTGPLIELARDVAKSEGAGLAMVVIDTLSRVIAGGNENSSEDMGALVMNLDRLRFETRAHVMIIHHSGKDEAKGARGHSLLRAATDTEIEIADKKVWTRKQRDMEQAGVVGFNLVPVSVGVDGKGRDVRSCVLEHLDTAACEFGALEPEGVEQELLDAFDAHIEETEATEISTKIWTRIWRSRQNPHVASDTPLDSTTRSVLRRARAALVAKGHVVENEEKQYVRVTLRNVA